MARRDRVSWDESLKERLLKSIVKKLMEDVDLDVIDPLVSKLRKAIDGFDPTPEEPQRLVQVLESYKNMKGVQPIHPKAINLSMMLVTNLPGEKFWLLSPTTNKGVKLESEVAIVEISIKQNEMDEE